MHYQHRITIGRAPLFIALLVAFALTAAWTPHTALGASPPRIGILHFLEVPALLDSRDGFLAALEEAGYTLGTDLLIDERSAQGDAALLREIAAEWVAAEYDLIFALGTPAAIAVAGLTDEIPILFAGVRDPLGAQIVTSLQKPGRNITGSSHGVPVEQQIRLVRELMPSVERIGTLYNPAEPNSVLQIAEAREWAAREGVVLIEKRVGSADELAEATAALASEVEAIFVPTDSTVVAGLEWVLEAAEAARVPVIGSDRNSVKRGVVAAYGADEVALGRATGDMAVRILAEGADPGSLAVVTPLELSLAIHLDAAERVGLTLPFELLLRADFRYFGEPETR